MKEHDGVMGQDADEVLVERIVVEAYPETTGAPDGLRRLVAAMATEHDAAAARVTNRRRALQSGLAMAAAAGVAAAAVIGPRVPAAYALRRMAAAAEDARSAHAVLWRVSDKGEPVRYGETWYEAGKWRIEGTDGLTIHRDGRNFSRVGATDLFLVKDAPDGPAAFNSSGFSVAAMVRDQARWGWKTKVESLGVEWVGGRLARKVLLQPLSGARVERSLLWADARTDLPFRVEHQLKTARGWRTGLLTEVEYNAPIPPAVFRLPGGARVADREEARREWAERLSRAAVAKAKFPGRQIVLRDVSVNQTGDVFVLYTAGKRVGDTRSYGQRYPGRDWAIDLKDDKGTEYVWQQGGDLLYTSSIDTGMPGRERKMEVDGERLEGDWFTPVQPAGGQPWPARRLTFSFRVAAENTHGPLREGGEGIERFQLTESAEMPVRVTAPGCDVLPAYMPFLPGGFTDPYHVRKEAALARAFWHRHSRGAGYDWERKVNGPPDRPYLEKALSWYREALRIGDEGARLRGDEQRDGMTLYNVSRMLRLLGREREAAEALREAKSIDPQAAAFQEGMDRKLDEYRAKSGLGPLNR